MAKGARAPLELLYSTTRGRNAPHARPPNHIERRAGIARENAVVIAYLEAGDIARMDCHESQLRRSQRTSTLQHNRTSNVERNS